MKAAFLKFASVTVLSQDAHQQVFFSSIHLQKILQYPNLTKAILA